MGWLERPGGMLTAGGGDGPVLVVVISTVSRVQLARGVGEREALSVRSTSRTDQGWVSQVYAADEDVTYEVVSQQISAGVLVSTITR